MPIRSHLIEASGSSEARYVPPRRMSFVVALPDSRIEHSAAVPTGDG